MVSTKNVVKRIPTIKKVTINSFSNGVNGEIDEKLLNFTYATTSYNFDYKNGALLGCEGVDYLTINDKRYPFEEKVYPVKIYHYVKRDKVSRASDNRYIVYASNKCFYSIKEKGCSEILKYENLTMENAPEGLNYNFNGEDVYILSKDGEGIIIINGDDFEDISLTPDVSSMSIHSERLFITTNTDKHTLWFSDDFDPTNWQISLDKAGFITLEDELGDMLKVVSFSGQLYIFRSYGITQLTAYGFQEDFIVSNVSVSQGKIYKDTITNCGEYIIYLTENGLYRFNGAQSVKVLDNLDEYILNKEKAFSCYLFGNFYLVSDMLFDKKVSQGVVVYNVKEKDCHILKGLNLKSITPIMSETSYILCAVNNVNEICKITKSGKFLNKPLKKLWKSGKSDFQIEKARKRLDKISIDITGEITLKVFNEYTFKTYIFSGKGRKEVKPNLLGEEFSIEISTYYHTPKIVKPILYLSYFKE